MYLAKNLRWSVGVFSLFFSCHAFSMESIARDVLQKHPFYASVDAGIFTGSFSNVYADQSDVISQNISESVQQRGYTEGLAVGYSTLCKEEYLLGAEFSANFDSHNAAFQGGAASSAFSDTTQIKNHFDFVFVPGILLSNSIAVYAKLGISSAALHDILSSPIDATPTMSNFNSTRTATWFAGGLGVKKYMTEHFSLFVEGNYHDYGVVNFSDFQNFTASYTHSSHVYSYAVVLGAAYHF